MSRVLLALCVLVPATAWLWPRPPAPVAAPPAADLSRTVARLQSQLGDLRDDVRSLDDAQSDLDADLRDVVDQVAPPAAPPAPRPEERWSKLEAGAEADAPDLEGGAEAEASVRGVLDPARWPGLEQVAVRCGSTLCRLDLRLATGEDRAYLVHELPNVMPWSGEGMFAADAERPGELVWYFARAGHALP